MVGNELYIVVGHRQMERVVLLQMAIGGVWGRSGREKAERWWSRERAKWLRLGFFLYQVQGIWSVFSRSRPWIDTVIPLVPSHSCNWKPIQFFGIGPIFLLGLVWSVFRFKLAHVVVLDCEGRFFYFLFFFFCALDLWEIGGGVGCWCWTETLVLRISKKCRWRWWRQCGF